MALRNEGFRIALDDVGAGMTSFADLIDYPLDIIKIDCSILRNARSDQGKMLLLSMIKLFHSLKLIVICEGVETEEDYLLSKEYGCDIVRGYYFYRPMPNNIVDEYLTSEGL